MLGGAGPAQAATAEVQALVDTHKGDAEAQAGKSFDIFKAVTYSSQVVAGTNYFVKVETGDEQVHLKIWKKLDGTSELSAVQTGKSNADAIGFF